MKERKGGKGNFKKKGVKGRKILTIIIANRLENDVKSYFFPLQ